MFKHIRMFCLGLIALLSLNSCADGIGEEKTVQVPPTVSASGSVTHHYVLTNPVIFNGALIRSFITLDDQWQPLEIGYELQSAFYQNLPNPNSAPENTEILIPLPNVPYPGIQQDQNQIFDHMTFHWYPDGTDPQGIFSFPKFDFHIYTISLAARYAIGANDPQQFITPDPEYIPDYYYGPVGNLAQMGSHWVDLLSPEFNGGQFTKTFIYGSYNGVVNFEEMSITRDYFASSSSLNDIIPIRQPALYQRDGYYPLNYHIYKSGRTVRVYLSDFVFRQASAPTY
ncbi:MAG: hypothetical protein KDD94_02575 [Calditrichaeota bacterium]|nr:hypothetical protein [Calditrichota bacterium]